MKKSTQTLLAFSGILAFGLILFLAPASAQAQVPGIVSQIGPSNTTEYVYPVEFAWAHEVNSTSFEVWIGDSSLTTVWQQTYPANEVCFGGTCVIEPEATYSPGAHSWYVRGIGPGGTGPWGDGFTFTLAVPQTPFQYGPSEPIDDSTPSFNWNFGPGAQYYNLWVGDENLTEVLDEWYEVGTQVNCSGFPVCSVEIEQVLPNGDYTWYVRGWSPIGMGNWSTGMEFSVEAVLPEVIEQNGPNTTQYFQDVTYSWEQDDEAIEYRLYVNDSSGNVIDQTVYPVDVCSGGTCEYTPAYQHVEGDYSWWIQGTSPGGGGPWQAEPMNFTVAVPVVAVPQSPSGIINDESPAYVWTESPGATYYNLWVGVSVTEVVDEWYEVGVDVACESGVCTFNSAQNLPEDNYTWYVRPWGPIGFGEWSSGLGFSVETP